MEGEQRAVCEDGMNSFFKAGDVRGLHRFRVSAKPDSGMRSGEHALTRADCQSYVSDTEHTCPPCAQPEQTEGM